MNEELLNKVQYNSRNEPAWLQKKRALAVMLQDRFSLVSDQQDWLNKWQTTTDRMNQDQDYLQHEGQDYVALPIENAVEEYPELLQENLMEKAVQWQDSQLNAMHLALMDAGEFIYVPDDTRVKQPLEIKLTTDSSNPHNLIIIGAGAKVTIEEQSHYEGTMPLYAATEILVGTGAQVEFRQVNTYRSKLVYHAVHAYQARESHLDIVGLIPEAQRVVSSFYSFLDGQNSHWNASLAAVSHNNCQQDIQTLVDGYGEETSAQVNEWGWQEANSQLHFAELATVDDEPLDLRQAQVVGEPGKLTRDLKPEVSEFETSSQFFGKMIPANSWLKGQF